jgi:hypothetical protein
MMTYLTQLQDASYLRETATYFAAQHLQPASGNAPSRGTEIDPGNLPLGFI